MTLQAHMSAMLCIMTHSLSEKYITAYLPYNSFTLKVAGGMESKLRNTIMSV